MYMGFFEEEKCISIFNLKNIYGQSDFMIRKVISYPNPIIPRERKRQCEFTGSMVDLYFPIYAMKTMMENNHETRYGGGAMNLREIPEGYMMQQVGVTALRNGDGSFRPAVPIHMLVPTAAAIEAEERQAADAAGLFTKLHQKSMEARYEELTGESARLPEELQ